MSSANHIGDRTPRDTSVASRRDDVVLAVLLIMLGLVRVVIAIADRETFGAEATVAIVMTVLGLAILLWRT